MLGLLIRDLALQPHDAVDGDQILGAPLPLQTRGHAAPPAASFLGKKCREGTGQVDLVVRRNGKVLAFDRLESPELDPDLRPVFPEDSNIYEGGPARNTADEDRLRNAGV